ncbi:hypothetical protein NM208_g414 [Fusarium decemcellulare]|uniref:Uncharacterized protein n=1 Tax=Fusarium decemcellulare TaxID=57161 RepID=A0ACC1SZV4_9HYPO|nr:hypothetical protein NM208_g414 [Fusarium decemcellulare]
MAAKRETGLGPHHQRVIIIGGGFGGVAMACQLKRKLGCTDFCVLERQSGIGGTWWINNYPGIACDIPSPFYSLSFAQKPDWSTFFAPGKEIGQYLEKVVNDFELSDKFHFNTDVVSCKWNTETHLWEVACRRLLPGLGDLSAADRRRIQESKGPSSVYSSEKTLTCSVLVSAVGGLVEPAPWPANVPGKDKFNGKIMHSARWDSTVDFNGKNVVVVGTGCSAAQLVPRLLSSDYGVSHVTQLMREPPWVLPRVTPPFGDSFYERWSPFLCSYMPNYVRAFRAVVAFATELDFQLFGASRSSEQKRLDLQEKLLRHMKETVPSKYHEILTPQYSIGCKRRIYDTAWFPCLYDDRIELTTLAMESIDEKGVTLRPGPKTHPKEKGLEGTRRIPADIIVLANGFAVNRWFHPLEVVGSKGMTLQEEFDERGGPQLYRGTSLDGFPNMFVLFGPNSFTGHSSVVLGLENQVNHAIQLIRPVLSGEAQKVEVKRSAVVRYNAEVQSDLKNMVWNGGGCSNWYVGSEGRNTMSYPYSMAYQTIRFMFPTWDDWELTWAQEHKTCGPILLDKYRSKMTNHQPLLSLDHRQDLSGKVAIVTGASKGIGYAIALHLAKRGVGILATSTSASKHIDELHNEIKSFYAHLGIQPPKVAHKIISLEDQEAHVKMADAIKMEFEGKLDIFINNAAVTDRTPPGELEIATLDKLLLCNIRTPALVVDELVKRRYFRSQGRIVFLSSAETVNCEPTVSVYASTKAANEAMVRCYANAFGGKNASFDFMAGTTANSVLTGLTETGGVQQYGQQVWEDLQKVLGGEAGYTTPGQTRRCG